MAVNTANILAGPGTLYSGAFGATEPADAAVNSSPAASAWTDAGATKDGVTISVAPSYLVLAVDQVPDAVGRRLISREVSVQTNMAEGTLDNLKTVLNGGTVASGAGYRTYDPADDTAASQLTYSALLFDGWAPTSAAGVSKRRRLVARKVLSVEEVGLAYKTDEQQVLAAKFAVHYVSSSIKPYRIIDET